MAYSYQQNIFMGSHYGWVKYNITPDFSSTVAAGETVRIEGRLWCIMDDIRSICAYIEHAPGMRFRQNVNAPLGRETPFEITFTMPETQPPTGAGRFFTSMVNFCMWTEEGCMGDPEETMEDEQQALTIAQYRLTPSIRESRFERVTLRGGAYTPDDEGTSVLATLRATISPKAQQSDITQAYIVSDGTRVNLPSSVVTAMLGSGGYVEHAPALFAEQTFDTGHAHTFRVGIGDDYDTAETVFELPRAFANVHLSGAENGGVAFGKFSASTEENPLFECVYPARMMGGIDGVTNFAPAETEKEDVWLDSKIIGTFDSGGRRGKVRRTILMDTNTHDATGGAQTFVIAPPTLSVPLPDENTLLLRLCGGARNSAGEWMCPNRQYSASSCMNVWLEERGVMMRVSGWKITELFLVIETVEFDEEANK